MSSCSDRGQINGDSIKIEKISRHPSLVDHERKLITVDKNQKTIDELEIYPDSGNGCESFLFDSETRYVLVDCDGQWFSIDKTTGALKSEGWKWDEKLPDRSLGRFQSGDKESFYTYSPETNFKEKDVYKFKDPR